MTAYYLLTAVKAKNYHLRQAETEGSPYSYISVAKRLGGINSQQSECLYTLHN
jgi:hypothetical protein